METNQLTAGQISSLRDLVNDKQDTLYRSLHVAEVNKHENRARGLRDTLRYWDSVEVILRNASARAFDAQHAAQARATCDDPFLHKAACACASDVL